MKTNDKKIVVCSCVESGVEMVDYLLSHGIKISYFVSLDEEQGVKYQVSGYASFEHLSKKYGIPIYYPKEYSLKDNDDLAFFEREHFDLLLIGGWQRLIPENILQTLTIGGIGIHGSSEFLPKGRGRSPVNWSLIEGKKRYIAHLFLLTPGVDDGKIIDYQMCDINEWDTCRTLYYKASILTKEMLIKNVPKILSGDFKSTPQEGQPTYYPKRSPEDGLIDWSRTVFQIYDFIRALTKPYPGAFTYLNNKKVFIWAAQPFDTRITYHDAKEGEIVEVFANSDFVVNCNSGLLLVTQCDTAVSIGDVFSSHTSTGT